VFFVVHQMGLPKWVRRGAVTGPIAKRVTTKRGVELRFGKGSRGKEEECNGRGACLVPVKKKKKQECKRSQDAHRASQKNL